MSLFSNSKVEHLTSEVLSEHIDNQLTSESFMEVETHLTICTDCSFRLDQLSETVNVLRSLPSVKSPRQFVLPKVYKQSSRSIPFAAPVRILAYAAVLFLVVLVGGMLTTSQSSQGEMPILQSFMASPEVIESDINPEKVIQLSQSDGSVESYESGLIDLSDRFIWFITFSLITIIVSTLYIRSIRQSKSY